MKNIFISYSRKDLAFVEKFARDLQQAGYDIWYDLTDLEGGDRWASKIQAAIDHCDAFLTVISPHSVVSEWVEKEFLYASNAEKHIVPVLHETARLPLWLLDMHYLDIQGKNYKKSFPLVLAAIEEQPVAPPQPATGLAALSPAWIGGITAGVALLLVAFFGLRALLAKPEPPSISTATLDALNTAAGETLQVMRTAQASAEAVEIAASTPIPTETIVFVLSSPSMVLTELRITPTPAPSKTDSAGVEMLLVPAGSFTMGSDQGTPGEGPIHVIGLDAFYMDKYEVTNAEYKKCVDDLVCELPTNTRAYLDSENRYKDHPVVFVAWQMAETYCEWRGARLPTEAEWEKAARGTNLFRYPWGNKFDGKIVNFCDVTCLSDWADKRYNDKNEGTAPVGSYEDGKSPYGLYDMAGNALEWVADWYDETYYQGSPKRNPTGPDSGSLRVLRGGSWFSNLDSVRTFTRDKMSPEKSYNYIGFRCSSSVTP